MTVLLIYRFRFRLGKRYMPDEITLSDPAKPNQFFFEGVLLPQAFLWKNNSTASL
ncbi:hypothetical protein LJE86_02150 [bacterium BMS3Abin03]|nr:hypothetical protein [bacterium BMS3Abin03]